MLYKVQKKDVKQAGNVLADAFHHDPVWNKVFAGEPDVEKKFPAFFETPVMYCLKYGEVYTPSENLEGVIGWVPGKYADMNIWPMIRSGAILPAMKIGFNVQKKMEPMSKAMNRDRHEHMAGRSYLYLLIVGVATRLQGKGLGRELIGAAINKAERDGQSLYLETETEENVQMYEHFGFRLLQKITLPVVNLPMWEMVREP